LQFANVGGGNAYPSHDVERFQNGATLVNSKLFRWLLAALLVAIGSQARGAMLTGVLSAQNVSVNLTDEGTKDWAIWGCANGGTSTSLVPDVRKVSGSAISNLTDINPPPSLALRGIGQFSVPFSFSWTNGNTVLSAANVSAGLQNFSPGVPFVAPDGYGFSFTVPASPILETLRVYVSAHHISGRLMASLSDNSAPAYIDTGLTGGFNSPGFYTIQYASATPAQTLNVRWTQFSANGDSANVAIYAVTLVREPSSLILFAVGGLVPIRLTIAKRKWRHDMPQSRNSGFNSRRERQ
jgi:hypothetical protein